MPAALCIRVSFPVWVYEGCAGVSGERGTVQGLGAQEGSAGVGANGWWGALKNQALNHQDTKLEL